MATVNFDYEPRDQFMPFHTRDQRFAVMVCHRRAGKTVACINDIIAKACYTKKKNARFAYIAPFYRQAKDVAWEYLKQFAKEAIVGKPRESELRVKLFNGAWITLYGADNPDAFRGMYFDGVVIDEYGDMRPKLWTENVLPTLADRQGWAVFIGTPKGPNHFKEMWERAQAEPERWFSFMLKASESGIIPPAELEMQRGEQDEAEYLQEYECSFTAAVRGAFWSNLLSEYDAQANLRELYNPELQVQVVMDIGRRDNATAWVWQEASDGVSMVNYHEKAGTDPGYWGRWFTEQGYDTTQIEKLWLPHDAVAKTFATKRSTIEQFMDLGYQVAKVPKLSHQDGINAGRVMIPVTYFDERCKEGVAALHAYKRKWDDVKKVFSREEDHDWAADTGAAFRYFAVVAKQGYATTSQKRSRQKYAARQAETLKPVTWTLDDLWKDHDDSNRTHDVLRIQ